MNDKPQDSRAVVSARRRLIRGAFAAPAALTLYSGGAFAAPSFTCVARQNQPGNAINAPVNPNSTFVRVRNFRLINGLSLKNAAFFVSGADVASLLPPGGSYLTSAQWQCVAITGTGLGFTIGTVYLNPRSAGGNTVSGNTSPSLGLGLNLEPVFINPRPGSGNSPVATKTFIGVRIDGGGKVVGVQNVFSGNTALTTTCWTSIGGANAFP